MRQFNSTEKFFILGKGIGKRESLAGWRGQINQCYCPNGHSLISENASFHDHKGILVKFATGDSEGLVALSPFFGDSAKMLVGKFQPGDIWQACCPDCAVPLPVYSQCSCGGSIIALFGGQHPDFANCMGVCNRVGCYNATIKHGHEFMLQALEGMVANCSHPAGWQNQS